MCLHILLCEDHGALPVSAILVTSFSEHLVLIPVRLNVLDTADLVRSGSLSVSCFVIGEEGLVD